MHCCLAERWSCLQLRRPSWQPLLLFRQYSASNQHTLFTLLIWWQVRQTNQGEYSSQQRWQHRQPDYLPVASSTNDRRWAVGRWCKFHDKLTASLNIKLTARAQYSSMYPKEGQFYILIVGITTNKE